MPRRLSQSLTAPMEVCPGGDAPRIGMDRTAGFLGLGLLEMRMGLQDGRFAHRRLDRQNEKSVRKATRQGVRISCLRPTPESQEPQTLSHSDGMRNAFSPGIASLTTTLKPTARL